MAAVRLWLASRIAAGHVLIVRRFMHLRHSPLHPTIKVLPDAGDQLDDILVLWLVGNVVLLSRIPVEVVEKGRVVFGSLGSLPAVWVRMSYPGQGGAFGVEVSLVLLVTNCKGALSLAGCR